MSHVFTTEGLKKTRWSEHLFRFGFGGAVTVVTSLLAHRWGPALGGLFMAFPSILPASLTLVKSHDGRRKTVADARGARAGTVALAAFALTVTLLASRVGACATLAAALGAWILSSGAVWLLLFRKEAKAEEAEAK
jgi:hypothetical protein